MFLVYNAEEGNFNRLVVYGCDFTTKTPIVRVIACGKISTPNNDVFPGECICCEGAQLETYRVFILAPLAARTGPEGLQG